MSQGTDPVAPALQSREPGPVQRRSAALHRLPAIVAPRVPGTCRATKSEDRGAAARSSRIPKPMERDSTTRGSRRHAPQLPMDSTAICLPPDKHPSSHQQPQPEKPVPEDQRLKGSIPDDRQLQGAHPTAERHLEEPTASPSLTPAGARSRPPQLPEETPTDQPLLLMGKCPTTPQPRPPRGDPPTAPLSGAACTAPLLQGLPEEPHRVLRPLPETRKSPCPKPRHVSQLLLPGDPSPMPRLPRGQIAAPDPRGDSCPAPRRLPDRPGEPLGVPPLPLPRDLSPTPRLPPPDRPEQPPSVPPPRLPGDLRRPLPEPPEDPSPTPRRPLPEPPGDPSPTPRRPPGDPSPTPRRPLPEPPGDPGPTTRRPLPEPPGDPSPTSRMPPLRGLPGDPCALPRRPLPELPGDPGPAPGLPPPDWPGEPLGVPPPPLPGDPSPIPRRPLPEPPGDPSPAPRRPLPEPPGDPSPAPRLPLPGALGDSCPASRLSALLRQPEVPGHVLQPLTAEPPGDPCPTPQPPVRSGEPRYVLWPELPGDPCPTPRLPLPEGLCRTFLPPLLWPGDPCPLPWLPLPERPVGPRDVPGQLPPGPSGDSCREPQAPPLAAPGEPLDILQQPRVCPPANAPLQTPRDRTAGRRSLQLPREASPALLRPSTTPPATQEPQLPRDDPPVFLRWPDTPPAPQELQPPRDDSPVFLRWPDTPPAPQEPQPPQDDPPVFLRWPDTPPVPQQPLPPRSNPRQDTHTSQELQTLGETPNTPGTQPLMEDAPPPTSRVMEDDQEGPNAPQNGRPNLHTVYLQYPLTTDALNCPICMPPRPFTELRGLTRHLMRCHGLSTAFSCALCSLPFESQKKCKAHQTSCKKARRTATLASVPRHPVPQPTAPRPQRARGTLSTAARKPTPAPELVVQGTAAKTTATTARNTDRAPSNWTPFTSTQVARKLSELRLLSAPSNQGDSAPRRVSAPPRMAARDPAAGGINAGSRHTLQAPATRVINTTPQPALRTSPTGGAGTTPQTAPHTATAGGPAATTRPQHQTPVARQTGTAPRDARPTPTTRRPHAPTTTPRTTAARGSPGTAPTPTDPNQATPSISNATTPLMSTPQGPTERSPEPQTRSPTNQSAGTLPTQAEEHEDRRSTTKPATPWQTTWIEKLQAAASFEEFDLLVNRLTQELSAETASKRTPNQETTRPAFRRPAPNRATSTRGAGRRNASHRYDPAAASRIQKLYRSNRLKAVREVLDGPPAYCTIPPERLYRYFLGVFGGTPRNDAQRPECLRPLPRVANADGLEADFTPKEVAARLSRTKNTAPGKDGIPYGLLKKRDPGCLVLSGIFNLCRRFGRSPTSWKKAMTVLIHKKGERDDPSNWRPISLCSTMYKLYASCLAARITEWATTGGAISSTQKGFMPSEGCYEHNFLLQTVLQTTRRAQKQCAIAWLDLANAFGSIPHHHIFSTLREFGMPETFLRLIRELYEGCSTTIRSVEGETAEIPIRSGVKQGCPLSPIIFNLAMEPLLRAISDGTDGFDLHEERVSILAYADDLVLTADDPERLQSMLNTIGRAADWTGLRFNAKKCASLHIDGSKRDPVLTTEFLVQGEPVVPLAEGQAYQHLGTPTGFRVQQTPEDTIREILQDAAKIDASLLAPWQKINALNTFLIPRIAFVLRGSAVAKVPLTKADNTIRQLVKKWLSLPQRASNELVYIAHRHGGANVPRMGDLCDIAVITHAFRLLTCPDAAVKNIATTALRAATAKRIAGSPSDQDVADFLNGSLDGEFGRFRGDVASLWSRARNATRRLGKRLGCRWVWSEDRREPGVLVPRIGTEDNTIVSPGSRGMLEKTLKAAVHALYVDTLKKKPDQGKAFEVTSKWDSSNHFLPAGSFTRFADWRFIHRARLNCVPLNGAVRHGNRDKRCRKCGYAMETLPHVLCSCKPHARAWQLRHNAVQDRLVKAIAPHLGKITVNRAIPGTDSPLRPDIVVTDEDRKKIILVDVTIPFENRTPAFREARSRKLEKYAPLADTLRSKGYEVCTEALIVGALGAWDPCNERVLRTCGVGRRYAQLMRRLMVSDTIRWSRDIYTEHITGHRQYQE